MSVRDRIKRVIPTAVLQVLRASRERIRGSIRDAMTWRKQPNLYRIDTPERLGVVYTALTHLSTAERLFLYCIVRGTRRQRVLEIGSAAGGSASIIAAAMEDNRCGMIVGIDPLQQIDSSEAKYYGRFNLLNFAAPSGLDEASRTAGGPIRFSLLRRAECLQRSEAHHRGDVASSGTTSSDFVR